MEQNPSLQTTPDTYHERGIPITSQNHWSLFCHDEEIIRHFHDQIEISKQHIVALEEKLRKIKGEYEVTRNTLYNSETSRFNEADARMALQRHLRLEQISHQECAAAYASLQRQHLEMVRDVDSLSTFNEILRGEVERGQRIINSMATKISEYEIAAQLLTISPGLQQVNAGHQELLVESSSQTMPQIRSTASSQASAYGSPSGGVLVSLRTPSEGSLPDIKIDVSTPASEKPVGVSREMSRNSSIEYDAGSSGGLSGFVTVTQKKKPKNSKKRKAI